MQKSKLQFKIKKLVRFSIIIPVREINDYIEESMRHIKTLNFRDFEVIILPDKLNERSERSRSARKVAGARLVATGKKGPAEKRDLGAKISRGEILAFLDDDAYPQKDWLTKAEQNFRDEKIAALGGPALTPPNEPFRAQLSAGVFESFLAGGNLRFRYLPLGRRREVEDWPSVNLFVRRDIFLRIGGFNCQYWPGEDTKLCLDILKTGKKIIYDPAVRVEHHRRPSVISHFRQVGNYGLHRGFFAKKYPATSLKFFYFLPSLFVLYLITAVIAIYFHFYGMLAIVPFWGYLGLLGVDAVLAGRRYRGLGRLGILGLLPILIFATNIWYGARFVKGFFSRAL